MEEILTLWKPQINYNEAQMSQTEQMKKQIESWNVTVMLNLPRQVSREYKLRK